MEVCCICYDNMFTPATSDDDDSVLVEEQSLFRCMRCKQRTHMQCLSKYMKTNSQAKCPMCRSSIPFKLDDEEDEEKEESEDRLSDILLFVLSGSVDFLEASVEDAVLTDCHGQLHVRVHHVESVRPVVENHTTIRQ